MAGGISLSWVWATGLIAFAFGLAVGVSVAYLAFGSKRQTRELHEQIDTLQQELDNYRSQVGSHFQRTSELVQKMTQSYREVYAHLATGSQALCRNPVDTPRLDLPETPSLEARPADQPIESTAGEEFSDAEVDRNASADDEDYVGDAPHVPALETEEDDVQSTPRRR